MNPTVKAKIDRIFQAYHDWWQQGPIPPASEEQIERVARWFAEHHEGTLPPDLAEFWRTTNGIDLDGYVLWATDRGNDISGIVDVNELYIDEFTDQFFLGTSDDIWMYSYHPASRKFRVLVMFELDTVETEFDTFDELADKVLTEALERAGRAEGAPREDAEPVAGGPAPAPSDDGTVRVEVTDGLVTSLEVDGVDPQLVQRILDQVNGALRADQAKVLAAIAPVCPSHERLLQVLEETSSEVREAARRSVGGS